MGDLDAALPRRAHQVVEFWRDLQDLEAVFAEISISAHVAILKTEDVAEFMGKRPK